MAPVNPIRIRLRYADFDTFVAKFSPNVTRGGVFLASRHVQPVGTVIGFEIQLLGGEVALAGQGRVTWVKELNPAESHRPHGMGVQFISLDAASKPILARILRVKEDEARRRTTGPLTPLGSLTGRALAEAMQGRSNGAAPAVVAIDTSVDLAAEFGLPEDAIRHMIERRWLTDPRTGDDLADLLKPEAAETVSLAQALADLPRLLDPQFSRRRVASAFRGGSDPREPRPASGEPLPAGEPPSSARQATLEITMSEATNSSRERDPARPEAEAEAEKPAVVRYVTEPLGDADRAVGEAVDAVDAVDEAGEESLEPTTDVRGRTVDLDTTDMTSERDPVESLSAIPETPPADSEDPSEM